MGQSPDVSTYYKEPSDYILIPVKPDPFSASTSTNTSNPSGGSGNKNNVGGNATNTDSNSTGTFFNNTGHK